ncbi:hypothetical protein MKJ04_09685 [Pontibacter sp. E15-1]|uniref:hypothetical protein n=1 Tax=Pontibacter sp. E15-1 TaxID=2919918 RepID=UPI001F5035CC|nr:hypothetical protein [Pontibacter sp. E15-1]MCJ8165113.1 hypothetical protein [Pontibacter sp. E15-1]
MDEVKIHNLKSLSLIIGLALSIVTVSRGQAQATQKAQLQNPYTLVYAGAITENVKGKVNIHPVTYKIDEITIAANVYTPPNTMQGRNIRQ